MMEPIQKIFPQELQSICRHICDNTEEIRLRAGSPPFLIKRGREYCLPDVHPFVQPAQLEHVIRAACGGSGYALRDSMQNGFVTLKGGHRIGICGEAAVQDGKLLSFRALSSIVIRIARQHTGCGMQLSNSTLILGPPGSGKTTILRDCVRILSDESGVRVALVDERCEIAACRDGIPQLHVGRHTDVLSGVCKADGALMVLKTMNPQWIAVDEITGQNDAESVIRVTNCGVKVLATAHGETLSDLLERPVYRTLMENRCFEQILLLSPDHSRKLMEVPSL